jgi:PST family polysaccharide transporter
MNLKKTTSWASVFALIRMFTGLISVKVVASIVGPSGLAYVGQFQSFLTITNSGSNLGVGQGTIKYLAEFKSDKQHCQRILSTSFCLTVISSTCIAILILLFHKELSLYLFKTEDFSIVMIVLGFSISIYSLGQILIHALNGFQEIKKLMTARILASILGLIITVVLVLIGGVKGALIALILSQIIGFGVVVYFSIGSSWFSRSHFFKGLDKESFKLLGKYSLMTFTSVILLNVRQIYLRDYIIVELSPEAAGYWQSMWKISEIYLSVITFSLSVYYLPKLSSIKDNKALRKEILDGYKVLIPIVLVLSLSIFLLRDLIILILFTAEFNAIRDLFFYQLIGDIFKIAAWILSFLMVAKAMTKTFIITEIIFIALFLFLSLYLVQIEGLIGMTHAFAITYAIYFFTMLYLFRDLMFNQTREG